MLAGVFRAEWQGLPQSPDNAEHELHGAELWRREHWGTSVIYEARPYDEPPGALTVMLESASPGATLLIEELARQCTDLRIVHLVIEDNDESGAVRTFADGELVGSESVRGNASRLAELAESHGFAGLAESLRSATE